MVLSSTSSLIPPTKTVFFVRVPSSIAYRDDFGLKVHAIEQEKEHISHRGDALLSQPHLI
jgi:hypothetical protein